MNNSARFVVAGNAYGQVIQEGQIDFFRIFISMNAVGKSQYVTPEAFFEYIESIEGKAEYYDGIIVDMASSAPEHALITANTIIGLGKALDGTDCRVYSSDLMVEVDTANSYLLPDVSVICGPPERSDKRKIMLKNPMLIVEVLSDSTSARDQGIKWFHYRMLPGLRAFITIEQYRPLVYVHSLNDAEEWVETAYGKLTDIIPIKSLGISIPMAAIYANVEFEE